MRAEQLQVWTQPETPYRRRTMAEILRVPWNGLTGVGSFSGCGGSSLGLTAAGFSMPYAIEFSPAAAATYRANFPSTFIDERDIREISAEDILRGMALERGQLDLFEGSPPCASFSSAGRRSKDWGKEKVYSDVGKQRTDDLFWEWARLLDGLFPRAFIAENVPGMLHGPALEEYAYKIIEDLTALGYRVNAKVLNSAHYGVPQHRERLIFLGLRQDVGEGLPEHPPPTTPWPITIRQALEAVPDPGREDVTDSQMEGRAVGRTWHAIREAQERGEKRPDMMKIPCQRCGDPLPVHEVLKTSEAGLVLKARCADGEAAVIIKNYFMLIVPELGEPCATVTATGALRGAASVTHPTECRKMTPAELLSVCGFPADFQLVGTREQRCERMGRAVTPPLYEAVGKRMAEYLCAA